MATTQMISSSTFRPPRRYDVFLSFRGADTRTNFTDHLCAALHQRGIHTFRDDEELARGSSISPELLKAIEESRISVVIFSRNYASSTWCLDELVKIVERMNMSTLVVLPVFYDVEPIHVRKQTGNFEEAFAKHEQVFKDNMEKVKKWRDAMTQISNCSGWDVKDRYETKVIEDIIGNIFSRLDDTFASDFEDIVGMDYVKKIELDLGMGFDEVHMVGICGMPGIGKTTIARAIFERVRNQYEASSFIDGVAEISKREGILHLQALLYGNLLKIKVSGGEVNMIRSRLRNKRVLIILDDVDLVKQIEAVIGNGGKELYDLFGQGSRIIITTRDESLLRKYEPKIYKVEKLPVNEALILFSRKAFKKDHPSDDYTNLSYDFVGYADGLPLALEVLGSFLYGRTLNEWSATLESLKDHPNTGILNKLKLGFDGLEVLQKKIFLDIACFFKGDDVERVKKIFRSCGYYPDISISVLLERSLVTILGGKLWMHDLLQELGRDIVRGQSEEVPVGNRSRLWLYTDALRVLLNNEGTEFVEGIFLRSPQLENVNLSADPFVRMSKLRLLKIYNVIFSDCHEFLSNELRLLEWYRYPLISLPSSFKPDKLVELHLPQSKIQQIWKEIRKPLEMLVIINLSDCEYLTKSPDFNATPKLERLILKGCKRLAELHPSIGVLQQLNLLNLENCECITTLPHIISLRSLTIFNLSGCSRLKMFPEIEENMKQLAELHLDGTAIIELPKSIKHLTGLILLSLRGCKNLVCLPSVVCTLTSLQILNLSGCSKLDELPENLGSLECLQELDVSRTAIRQLPPSIVLMKNLKLLSAAGCRGQLPHNSWCSLFGCCLLPSASSMGLQLPTSLSGLISLTKLDLSNCDLPEGEIPDDFGCLSSLQHLNLSGNNFMSIPESICQLTQLNELILNNCSKLQSLPIRLPLSLRSVSARDCTVLPNESTIWTSTATGLTIIDCGRGQQLGKPQLIPLLREHIQPMFQKFYEGPIYGGTSELQEIIEIKKIPAWFSRSGTGSSITIQLPPDLDGNSKWMGFVLCFVCEVKEHDDIKPAGRFDAVGSISTVDDGRIVTDDIKPAGRLHAVGSISTDDGRIVTDDIKPVGRLIFDLDTNEGPPLVTDIKIAVTSKIGSRGVLFYEPKRRFRESLNIRASIVFNEPGVVEVKEWGFRLIFEKDVAEFVHTFSRLIIFGEEDDRISLLDHMTNPSTWIVKEKSNESNELEQETNALDLTHVAELEQETNALETRFLIQIEPHTSTDSPKIVGQLRRNVESLLAQLFEGHWPSYYDYGFIFSLRAILPWFSHQSTGTVVKLPLPPDLYNNKKWVGFALYVAFTLPPGVCMSKKDSESCFYAHLRTSQGVEHYVTLVPREDNFMGSYRLCVIHISRVNFPQHCDRVFARFGCITPGVEVEMCGIRLVYQQDIQGLIQTITQCTISSPPVYYARTDDKVVLEEEGGQRFSFIHMAKSLLEEAKSIDPSPILESRVSPSKETSTVGHVIHLHVSADDTPINPLVKTRDSRFSTLMEWKTNLVLLLQGFFAPSLSVSLTLSLRRNAVLSLGNFDPYSEWHSIFPQTKIPEWLDLGRIVLTQNFENDNNWMGLVICSSFSVTEHPTSVLKNMDSGVPYQKLMCHITTKTGYCLGPRPSLGIFRDKFTWLYRRGFIWLAYIPRCPGLCGLLKEPGGIKFQSVSDVSGLWAEKTTVRSLFKQDMEEFKQTLIQMVTSFFDNEDQIRRFIEDDDKDENRPTHADETEANIGTGSSFLHSQHERKPTPILQGEISASYCSRQHGLQDFDRYSIYNSCFPPSEIPERYFGHHSSGPSVTIPLPPDLHCDNNWIGLALCAYFSVLEYPSSNDLIDNLVPGISHHLICHLESNRGSLKPLHAHCITKQEFEQLYQGGFIWVSYMPRGWYLDQLNECSLVKASIGSDPPGLRVDKCALRLVFQNDEEEFKQTTVHCKMASLSDHHKGTNKRYREGEAGSSSTTGSTNEEIDRLERLQRANDIKGKRVIY